MFLGSINELAHSTISPWLKSGGVVIDATAGNGHDSLFLAQQIGANGTLLSIDIQPSAIESTKKLLESSSIQAKTYYINASHDDLDSITEKYLSEEERSNISLVYYNLGYLPGGNKEFTTTREITLTSIRKALALLSRGGVLVIVMYPGHNEGSKEKEELLTYTKTLLDKEYTVVHLGYVNKSESSPSILVIGKS